MARAKRRPGEVLKASTPGRFQVQVHYYDPKPRAFRPVPAHSLTFDVQTPAEVRRLYKLLEELVAQGAWRDAAGDGADPGGARGVRSVPAEEPVDEE